MRSLSSLTVLALATAGDYSRSDDASLIQSVAARKQASSSVHDRLSQMLHQSKQSTETCIKCVRGDRAPVNGIFVALDGTRTPVSMGEIAPSAGSFCVPSSVFSLLERSFGMSTAADFEKVLVGKQGNTESTASGKSKAKKSVDMWGISYPDTGEQAIAVGDKNTIMRNIGGQWIDESLQDGSFDYDFRSVCTPDDNIERIVGTKGALFYHDNNDPAAKWMQETNFKGLTSEEKELVGTLTLNSIYFPDSGDDLMVAASGGYLLRWLHDAEKWILQKISAKGVSLNSLSCPDEGEGEGSLVVGDEGEVYMQIGRHAEAEFVKQTNIEEYAAGKLPDFKDVRYDEDEGIGKGVAMLTGTSGTVYAMIPKSIDSDGTPNDSTPGGNMFVVVADLGSWSVNTMHVEPGNKMIVAGDGGRVYECLINDVDQSKQFTTEYLTKSNFDCHYVKGVSRTMTRSNLHRSALSDMADVFHIVGDKGSAIRHESGTYAQLEYEAHEVTLKSVAFPATGENAVAIGSGGTVLKYTDGAFDSTYGGEGQAKLGADLSSICFKKSPAVGEDQNSAVTIVGNDGIYYNYEKLATQPTQEPLTSCEYGEAPNNPLYVVGEGGVILYKDDSSDDFETVTHDAGNAKLNFVTFSDDAKDVLVLGDGGIILLKQEDGSFKKQDSPTTQHLYGADFPHVQNVTTSSSRMDETIIVGAAGTALVYGLPVPGKWNDYCKGILQHRLTDDAGEKICDTTKGKWKDLKEDLYSVMYRESERKTDPVRVLATVVGAKGTFVQWGWNANGRNFQVMKETGTVEKDLYAIAQSKHGELTLAVGEPVVEDDEAEATIIRKNKDPVWVKEKFA